MEIVVLISQIKIKSGMGVYFQENTRHINSLMQVSHRSIILKLLVYTFFYYKQLHFGG